MDETQKEAGRALAIIRYVNTLKRLLIFMVLVAFCASGYALWEYRRELTFWAMASFGHPRIDEDRLELEMTTMMADIFVLSVAVWSVNLDSNQRRALFVRVRNAHLINLEGTGDLVLRPYSKLTAEIIELINRK